MRISRITAPACFLVLVAAIGSFVEGAWAQSGTISGHLRRVQPFVGGSARAYSLELGDSYVASIPENGAFQLSVPAGSYAVLSSMIAKRRTAQQIDVVRVAANKNANIRPKSLAAVAPGIRVSVGNFQALTADGKPVKSYSGKNIVWDDLLIVDLFNNDNPCKIRIMEDRKYGRYPELLNELKLQASRYSAKRINLKKALAVLNANAPQYRITGNFQVAPNMEALLGTASLRIVDLRNGQTVWSGQFSGLTDIDQLSSTLARSAGEALCMPRRVTGTFNGVQHAVGSGYAVDYTWTGSATFILGSLMPSDPAKPENLDVALYTLESSNIDSYVIDGTVGGCSKTGSVGSTDPQPPSAASMMVWLNADAQRGYRYVISIELMHLDALDVTIQCPDSRSVDPDVATAELQVADSEASYPYTQDPYLYQGTATLSSTTMNWNFTAGL